MCVIDAACFCNCSSSFSSVRSRYGARSNYHGLISTSPRPRSVRHSLLFLFFFLFFFSLLTPSRLPNGRVPLSFLVFLAAASADFFLCPTHHLTFPACPRTYQTHPLTPPAEARRQIAAYARHGGCTIQMVQPRRSCKELSRRRRGRGRGRRESRPICSQLQSAECSVDVGRQMPLEGGGARRRIPAWEKEEQLALGLWAPLSLSLSPPPARARAVAESPALSDSMAASGPFTDFPAGVCKAALYLRSLQLHIAAWALSSLRGGAVRRDSRCELSRPVRCLFRANPLPCALRVRVVAWRSCRRLDRALKSSDGLCTCMYPTSSADR